MITTAPSTRPQTRVDAHPAPLTTTVRATAGALRKPDHSRPNPDHGPHHSRPQHCAYCAGHCAADRAAPAQPHPATDTSCTTPRGQRVTQNPRGCVSRCAAVRVAAAAADPCCRHRSGGDGCRLSASQAEQGFESRPCLSPGAFGARRESAGSRCFGALLQVPARLPGCAACWVPGEKARGGQTTGGCLPAPCTTARAGDAGLAGRGCGPPGGTSPAPPPAVLPPSHLGLLHARPA